MSIRAQLRAFLRLSALAVIATVVAARAEVKLSPLFTDGAVLQREQPVRIWGSADVGESVEVEFGGQTATATTGSNGFWLVTLPSLPVSIEARELRVTGKNILVVRDVLVGDVWMCSGQSNMEFTVQNSRDGQREVATANQPRIRQIKIDRKLADQPLEEFSASSWRRAAPDYVGWFTAVGYYFAREMVRETGVPIGIINCTWSGTSIEPWMSAKALAERPEFAVVGERWRENLALYAERRRSYEQALARRKQDEAQAIAQGIEVHGTFLKHHRKPRLPAGSPDHPYPGNPSAIYNGMVHPLRHTAIRGVLWYQGEANAVRAEEYGSLFEASIRGWRETFHQPQLPFFWVQIANFIVDTDWPRLREEQGRALALPATGQAVAIDIGDPNDIHPTNKQEVGRRLSLIALAKVEHRAVEFSGPQFTRAVFIASEARVSFTHADGLYAKDGAITALQLAGPDRVFHPAQGKIVGRELIVASPAVPEPIAVRYAWSASPRANLYNDANLPAAPFRSDNW
jgi:sialate O-acetylesterase